MKPKYKILIVDDDIETLNVITISLQEHGYEVEGIINGDETIATVKKFKPDLIFMDILLSGSNGKDICKKLKEAKKTSSIPVILISAHTQVKDSVRECGADGFINKPFDSEDLLYGIDNFLPQLNSSRSA